MLVQVNGHYVNPFGWLCPGPTVPANDEPGSGVVIGYLTDVAIMRLVCAGAVNDDFPCRIIPPVVIPPVVIPPVVIRPAVFRPRLRLCPADE